MTLISQSALAKQIGISRQAVSKAVAQGLIPHEVVNGKKKINLDDTGVQLYIKENSDQRVRKRKNTDIDKLKEIVHPSEHDLIDELDKKFPNIGKGLLEAAKREQGKKKPSEKPAPKQPKKIKSPNTGPKNSGKSKPTPKKKQSEDKKLPIPPELRDIDTTEYEGLSAFDLNLREKIAKIQLAELKVSAWEKKLLPTDFIEDALYRHIEIMHSNIERYSGIKIKEVCSRAIEDGEVSPKHVEKMVSEMLKIIFNTTKSIEKEIKKYEPKV
jgi:DNA-binding transcriptional MocR family regulator